MKSPGACAGEPRYFCAPTRPQWSDSNRWSLWHRKTSSFLKKRSKRLLSRCCGPIRQRPPRTQKFFGSFFQKRTAFLPSPLARDSMESRRSTSVWSAAVSRPQTGCVVSEKKGLLRLVRWHRQADAVAAKLLGLIESGIGAGEQVIEITVLRCHLGEANADRNVQCLAAGKR